MERSRPPVRVNSVQTQWRVEKVEVAPRLNPQHTESPSCKFVENFLLLNFCSKNIYQAIIRKSDYILLQRIKKEVHIVTIRMTNNFWHIF